MHTGAANRQDGLSSPRAGAVSLTGGGSVVFGGLVSHLLFSCQLSECLATHSAASFSLVKRLIPSASRSGQRTLITQPNPGFLRTTKVGRCSDILRIFAY